MSYKTDTNLQPMSYSLEFLDFLLDKVFFIRQ